ICSAGTIRVLTSLQLPAAAGATAARTPASEASATSEAPAAPAATAAVSASTPEQEPIKKQAPQRCEKYDEADNDQYRNRSSRQALIRWSVRLRRAAGSSKLDSSILRDDIRNTGDEQQQCAIVVVLAE